MTRHTLLLHVFLCNLEATPQESASAHTIQYTVEDEKALELLICLLSADLCDQKNSDPFHSTEKQMQRRHLYKFEPVEVSTLVPPPYMLIMREGSCTLLQTKSEVNRSEAQFMNLQFL